MFSTERSDFGSTIAGYLFSAIALIFAALQLFNLQFDMFESSLAVPFGTLAFLLIVASAIALWKAYIIDGVTFMLVGLVSYAFVAGDVPLFLIVIGIAALATGFMSYRVGDVFVLGLNVLLAISMFLAAFAPKAAFLADNPVIAGIFLLIAGLVAGYLCLSDWMLVQDIALDYEEEMYGDCCCDDDCECGDDCDCEGECHCHDDGKQKDEE